MKKNYSFYLSLLAVPVVAMTFLAFSGGQPGQFAGPSAGESACTACHANNNNFSGSVVVGAPTSYTAGTNYQIPLSINGGNAVRYGFNITAQDNNGNPIGTWNASSGTAARSDGNGRTHAGASTSGSWTLDWTAPTTSAGPVTFHYSTVFGNGSGTGGDTVRSGSSNQVLNTADVVSESFDFYPNPVQDELTIELLSTDAGSVEIYSTLGERVHSGNLDAQTQLQLGDLATGVYLMQVTTSAGTTVKQIVKQ